MKIIINKKENDLLKSIDINIDDNHEYTEDEVDEILGEIYFNESTNVGYDDKKATELAHIADKIQKLID